MKVLALATVAFVALLSGPLGATTIYVDCDNTTGPWDGSAAHPYLHIQDGINAAVNGDTVLVAAGTYTGSGNRDLDFGGKAITVRSADPTDPAVVAATIIDCEASDPDQHRAFNFHSGETSDSILNGLTIRGGYVSGNYAAGRGGGIYCESSDPTIVNMVITGCSADHGGGICCMTASPTIVNCLIRENEGEDSGGGIASYSGSPTISGCTIGDNWTSFDSGGGLALSMHTGGDPVVTDCVITGNGATHHGGGIYFFSDAAGGEIRGCTITENVAGRGGPNGQSYGADGDGGGIYCSANTNPAITDCTIQENQAVYDGGGVYCASNSTPIFTDCTILGNWSRNGDGGGLCLGEAAPQLARCSVWRNEAGGGGGAIACLSGAAPTVTNTTLVGNLAGGDGGAVYCSESVPTIIACTIFENEAGGQGGGLYCDGASPVVTNTILWEDGPGEMHVASGSPAVTYCDVQGGFAGAGNISSDPRFVNTTRGDFHIRFDSPCVDAGNSAGEPPTDMDGEPRWDDPGTPNPGGPSEYCDIGSDEFVDTDGDGLPDYWEDSHGLDPNDDGSVNPDDGAAGDPDGDGLANYDEHITGSDPQLADTDRDGRNDATEVAEATNPCHPDNTEKTYYVSGAIGDNVYDGLAASWDGVHGPKRTIQAGTDATVTGWDYVVQVADGTYTGSGNKNLDFGGRAITVRSENGAANTIIDCETEGRGVKFDSRETSASVLEGFTITKGWAAYPWASLPQARGGAILCIDSSPLIADCIIADNHAVAGGGVQCDGGAPTVRGCQLLGNQALTFGGGICSDYRSRLLVTDSSITLNRADGPNMDGLGGGCAFSGWTSATVIMRNCRVTGNSSNGYAGGIYASCSVLIENCTIAGNTAPEDGGGLKTEGSGVTITNCTIADNSAGDEGGGFYCGNSGTMISNCIMWGNQPTQFHPAISLSKRLAYCDVEDGTGEIWFDAATCIDVDPQFALGGYHLRATSPCIDWCPAGPPEDLDGEARPFDVPGVGYDDPPEARTYDVGADEYVDTDGDGLPDYWETANGLDPNDAGSIDPNNGAAGDPDGDGLTNLGEMEHNVDPHNLDTDGDHVSDGDEVLIYGTDPLDATDTDGDGLSNDWETAYGFDLTDPTDATRDADGDLLLNVEEYELSSDPGDALSPAFIYVDDDNAGDPAQDGTLAHPYASIETAISAAVAPAVVKVLPGTYAEAVVMADGVWLVGSGAGNTAIGSLDAGEAILISGVSDGLVAGFTVSSGPTYSALRSINSTVTVRGCLAVGSKNGFGIGQTGGARLVNCVSAGNAEQGVWENGSAALTILNCTIADNGQSGVIRWGTGSITITNSIVWGNADDLNGYLGAFTVSYCDIGDGDFAGTAGNISADPLFVDAAGGNYRLTPPSPCIDAGTSEGAYSLDLRGVSRWDVASVPNSGGGARPWYDMGAYEVRPTELYVNGIAGDDSYDGLAPDWDPLSGHGPKATIQAGLDAAVAGDTVIVAPGTYTGDGNRDLEFNGKAITLRSEHGAAATVIDCAASASNLHRGVWFQSGEGASTVLDGFTIRGAYASIGGAIRCTNSDPTIRNCIFAGNYSQDAGGGIWCQDASPTIMDCVFSNNTAAGDGGGLHCTYVAEPLVQRCTFAGNAATSNGGGIYTNGSLTLRNCLLYGNRAAIGSGGGMQMNHSSATVANCTFANNQAAVRAGGIGAVYQSKPVITNVIVWGNSVGQVYFESSGYTLKYCDVQGGHSGTGNINADPLFVSAAAGDYHLRPPSPCIDAGDPVSQYGNEPMPNGGRVNMGAYGNTAEATRTPGDVDGDGDVDMDDLIAVHAALGTDDPACDVDGDGIVTFADLRLVYEHIPEGERDLGGIPTLWALDYMTPTDPSAHGLDPTQDQSGLDNDRDGRTNYEEYVAGTDPTDPASLFAVTAIECAAALDGDVIRVSWTVAPGKHYCLYCSEAPGAEATWVPAEGNYEIADGTAVQAVLVNSGIRMLFFKVEVW